MGRLRTPRVSQPQGPTSVDKRVLWAFLPLTTSSNYISFEGGSIRKGAVSSPVPSTAIDTGRTGPLRGIKPAANTGFVSVALPAAELNAAFAATGAGSVLIVCKSQSAAGHGSSVTPIFELQSSGSSWNHYPYTDGNIYVGPLSATRYLNGTVSGATAGIYDPHVAIATAKSGAQRFYVNGILRGSGSAAEAPALNTSANTSGFGEFGSVYLVVFFDYVLSDSEIKAYSVNPWQLFAPDARRIWVPVAAGGDTYTLTADSGSFALTGQDTALNFNRTLAADSGSFALTGQDAALTFNRTLAADSGSFALTGQDVTPTFSRVLSAASGSYALAGQDATLTYTPISGATYTLAAASGSFALAGQGAVLLQNRSLAAGSGSFALTGQDATLARGYTMPAQSGDYSVAGQDAALIASRRLAADSEAFALTGQNVTMTYSNAPPPVVAGAMAGRRMAVTGRRPDRLQTATRPAR